MASHYIDEGYLTINKSERISQWRTYATPEWTVPAVVALHCTMPTGWRRSLIRALPLAGPVPPAFFKAPKGL